MREVEVSYSSESEVQDEGGQNWFLVIEKTVLALCVNVVCFLCIQVSFPCKSTICVGLGTIEQPYLNLIASLKDLP